MSSSLPLTGTNAANSSSSSSSSRPTSSSRSGSVNALVARFEQHTSSRSSKIVGPTFKHPSNATKNATESSIELNLSEPGMKERSGSKRLRPAQEGDQGSSNAKLPISSGTSSSNPSLPNTRVAPPIRRPHFASSNSTPTPAEQKLHQLLNPPTLAPNSRINTASPNSRIIALPQIRRQAPLPPSSSSPTTPAKRIVGKDRGGEAKGIVVLAFVERGKLGVKGHGEDRDRALRVVKKSEEESPRIIAERGLPNVVVGIDVVGIEEEEDGISEAVEEEEKGLLASEMLEDEDGGMSDDSKKSITSTEASRSDRDEPTPTRPAIPPRSSTNFTSSSTICVPAAEVFIPKAEQLLLPFVDDEIRKLNEYHGIRFTPIDTPNLFGFREKSLWDDWMNAGKKEAWWKRLNCFQSRNKSISRSTLPYIEVGDDTDEAPPISGRDRRALLLPPFNLLPDHVTVASLKRNQTASRSAFGLQSLADLGLNGVLAAAASTYGINLITVESFRDLAQMLTLLLGAATNDSLQTQTWYKSIVVKVPAIISLDFVSAFGQAILWYWIFTVFAAVLVYEFYRFTGGWSMKTPDKDQGEGFDRESSTDKKGNTRRSRSWRSSYTYRVTVTFLATTLYLPLSKVAIGSLVWSSDFWVEGDPYLNGIPISANGDSTHYPPFDFCYRTTMLRPSGLRNRNWAWILIPISALTIFWLTLFLPYRLYQIVQREVPTVDTYTELGERRKDLNTEYERLLNRDQSPFSFLYLEYRRSWSFFKSIYMVIKLLNIILIVILTRENCIFRAHTSSWVAVIRQGTLVGFMTLFLLADAISKPYINYLSNNSDFVSRFGYVLISSIGLLVALDVKGKAALGGGVLLTVNTIVYLINGYFTIIGMAFAQRFIKHQQKRLDTSIDLFSPHLDLDKHLGRRIWAETISLILLAAPEFRMPKEEKLTFDTCLGSTDAEGVAVPTLLNFRGSVAERLAENTRILRAIGSEAYVAAVDSFKNESLSRARKLIERDYTGPDIYYRSTSLPASHPVKSCFGRVDVVPFPFVAIFRYDDDPSTNIRLSKLHDLRELLEQNLSDSVIEAKRVRIALRALESYPVLAPYMKTQLVGAKGKTQTEAVISYRIGKLSIERNSALQWEGYNYSSGFRVEISYEDGRGLDEKGRILSNQRLKISLEDLCVDTQFSLSKGMATFLRSNGEFVNQNREGIEFRLRAHRDYFRNESTRKGESLSYGFMVHALNDSSLFKSHLSKTLDSSEFNKNVRSLVPNWNASFTLLEERMAFIKSSRVNGWWYLLWDDLWRRNANDLTLMSSRPECFSPYYRSSICYRPLARSALENFLNSRGFPTTPCARGYFNPGFLNEIYMMGAPGPPLHTYASPSNLLPFEALDRFQPSRHTPTAHHQAGGSEGTGTGTDYDASTIRSRFAFPYEEVFDPSPAEQESRTWQRLWRWLGLVSVQHSSSPKEEEMIMLDLRQKRDGRWEVPTLKR